LKLRGKKTRRLALLLLSALVQAETRKTIASQITTSKALLINTMGFEDSFLLFNMAFGGGRRRGFGKAKKPKKIPKETWFEECKMEQLKQLCKACKLTQSGKKGDLISCSACCNVQLLNASRATRKDVVS
jgi:hypothetical protein